MEKSEIDYISNLISIAVAKGTPEESKVKGNINDILNQGCAHIQSKLMMLEAFKIAVIGDDILVKTVIENYDRITKGLGFGFNG